MYRETFVYKMVSNIVAGFLLVSILASSHTSLFAQEATVDTVQNETPITVDTEPDAIDTPDVPIEIPDVISTAEDTLGEITEPETFEAQSISSSGGQNSGNGASIKIPQAPKVDGNSGSLSYTYKFDIPEGRNNVTPNLQLNYDSQSANNQNFTGYGFNISIPYIKQNNINGTQTLYTDDNYTSNAYGDLVKTSSSLNTFIAKKNDPTQAAFVKAGSVWTITDNSGTIYVYGNSSDSQIADPNNSNNIYQWYINDITDTNGNNIHYSYVKDGGYVYPSSITYTNNTPNVSTGIYEVKFILEDRVDKLESYQPAFRVLNGKRIKNVDVYVNNVKEKSYNLRYVTGTNGVRSLLGGVSEVLYEDAGSKNLPETVFTYSQPQTANVDIAIGGEFDRVVDINGDGLQDFVYSRYSVTDNNGGYNTKKDEYLNNGDMTFTARNLINMNSSNAPGTQLPFPYPTEIPFLLSNRNNGNTIQYNNFFVDFDGDGYVDLLDPSSSYKGSPSYRDGIQQVNATSSLFWNATSSYNIPANTGNIDSLNLYGARKPYLNYRPYLSGSAAMMDTAIVYVDLNSDGLDDKIEVYSANYSGSSPTYTKNVWINNGLSFTQLSAADTVKYNLPRSYERRSNFDTQSSNLYIDTNFDGLTDIITPTNYGVTAGSATNTGVGMVGSYVSAGNLPDSTSVFSADLNADGLADVVYGNNGVYAIKLSKMKADLLTGVISSLGASDTFTYAPAASYKKYDNSIANKIAYPAWTVKTQTTNDGNGNAATKAYSYEDAYISRLPNFDNTLAGFGKVIEAQTDGTKVITYYHQGDVSNTSLGEHSDTPAKIGKVYRKEVYSSGGALQSADVTKWGQSEIVGDAYFVYPIQTLSRVGGVDTAVSYTFNTATQDLTQKVDHGIVSGNSDGSFVDTGNDKYVTDYQYVASLDNTIHLPSQITITNQSGMQEKQNKYEYDGVEGGVVKGNLSKTYTWISGADYASTTSSYDTYGLKTLTADAKGNATSYVYDTHNMYPMTVTEPLNMVTSYTYDYFVGKPVTVTNVNGKTYNYTYDHLGRSLTESIPGPATGSSVLKTQHVYTDTVHNLSIRTINYIDTTKNFDSYQYFDGLGRVIQTSEKAENGYNIRKTVYNTNGTVLKTSLPYNLSSHTKTVFVPNPDSPVVPPASTSTATTTSYSNTSSYLLENLSAVDTYISGSSPNTGFGNDPILALSGGAGYMVLIKFDISDLPALGSSDQVYLRLYNQSPGNSNYPVQYIKMQKLVAPFNNNTTWNQGYTPDYNEKGRPINGYGVTTDIDVTEYYNVWKSGTPNHGIVIRDFDYGSNLDHLVSTEAVVPNNQKPQLILQQVSTHTTDTAPLPISTPTASTDAGLYTVYTYDALQRVLTETNSVGVISHSYNGSEETVTDANGKQKKYTKDAYGNLTQVTEYLNGSAYITNYSYDSSGNLLSITDALGNIRNFTYDGRGLRTSAQDLHSPSDNTFGTYTYTYDANGNLVQKVTPNSNTVNYTYNELDQLISEDTTATPGIDIVSTYNTCTNGKKKLCTAKVEEISTVDASSAVSTITGLLGALTGSVATSSASSVTTNYTYNNLGNTFTESLAYATSTFTNTYTYNRQGNITNIKYPDNSEVQYVYGAGGLVNNINTKIPSGSFTPFISNIDYSSVNTISKINRLGVTTTKIYDATKAYRLAAIVSTSSSATLQHLTYGYDGLNNVTGIYDNSTTNTNKKSIYTYDDLYRLTSSTITNTASGTPYIENYTYNIIGNLLTKGSASTTSSYTYSNTNFANPHAPTTIGSNTLLYDNNGNLLADGVNTHTYNYRDRLTAIKPSSGATTTYLYDFNNQRVVQKNGSNITLTPSRYYTTASGISAKNIYLNDVLVGTIDGTTTKQTLTDHLSSTDKTLSTTGTILSSTDYLPYGTERLHTGTQSVRKYIGEELDTVSGLNYLNARYYDSGRGQFTSQDPVFWIPEKLLTDPQQLNSYSYARNNPLTLKDPSGLFSLSTGKVEKGDTLNSITNLLNKTNSTNYSVSQVAKLNNIKDINKINIGQTLIPNDKVPDITKNLLETSRANSKSEAGQNSIKFIYKVIPGNAWDVKSITDGLYDSSKYSNFVFDAEKVRNDFPGNFHYGYVGMQALNQSENTLLYGAGMAQVVHDIWSLKLPQGTSATHFDNLGDSGYIQTGINYWKIDYNK